MKFAFVRGGAGVGFHICRAFWGVFPYVCAPYLLIVREPVLTESPKIVTGVILGIRLLSFVPLCTGVF